MAYASFKKQSAASVPNAATDELRVFVDSADSILKTKDDAGVVRPSGVGTADELATTGAPVDVSAAIPPVAGQVLTATSPTTAVWQNGGAFPFTSGGAGAGGAFNTADSPVAASIGQFVRVDTAAGNVTVNLPAGHLVNDRIGVKLVSAATPGTNECVVDANAAETIDGALTFTLDTDDEWIILQSDGTNWLQVG